VVIELLVIWAVIPALKKFLYSYYLNSLKMVQESVCYLCKFTVSEKIAAILVALTANNTPA
jgi:hypothetical protein